MENSAIKSSAGSSAVSYKISNEVISKTKTISDPKLATASVILVDKYKRDDNTGDNPLWDCQNKIKIEPHSSVGRIYRVQTCRTTSTIDVDENQAIVKKLMKNPEMTVILDEGSIPLVAKNGKMTKHAKNEATCIKVEPKITRSRRISADKLIPYNGLILRSGKKMVLDTGATGSKVDENKSRRNQPVENCIGGSSATGKRESEPNPDPPDRLDGKKDVGEVQKKESTSYNPSLMDKILSKSKATMVDANESNNGDETVQKTAGERLSTDSEKKAIAPKKRRKCSVPLKSERIQTRQSRSITLMQAQNDFEHRTQSLSPSKDLETSKNGQKSDKASSNEIEKQALMDTEISGGQRSSKDVLYAQNLTNQKNIIKCKSPDRKSVVEKENCPQTARKVLLTSNKRTQANGAGNPKQKAGHVNAQTMPVYVSKIAVAKDASGASAGKSVGIKVLQGIETGEDEVGERRTTPKSKSKTFFKGISLLSRTNRSTDQRDGNTDSDGTVSNVESVPNSPTKEPWSTAAGMEVKLSDKLDPVQNESIETSANHKDMDTELRSQSTSRQPEVDTSRSRIDEAEPRFYVEASGKRNNDNADDVANQSQRWLRHYERPPSKAKNGSGIADRPEEGSTSMVENTASVNLSTPARKRGRPRLTRDAQGTEKNPEKKKKPSTRNGNNTAANGSGLTLRELEQLFFKYFQDGHFRVDPGQRPIIIYSRDLHQNFSSRIQCYDPRKYLPHSGNTQSTNTPSAEFEHRIRASDPNSQNFSNQPTIAPYTNCGQYGTRGNNLNNLAFTSPVSSYMQPGYGSSVSYQQNSNNVMGNNSNYNSCSAMATGTDSMSTSNGNELNYSPHAQQLRQNLMPYKEMDLTMNNGMNLSTNAMHNSPTNDITNSDWNEVNSALDSVNGILMDLNSMDQTVDGSPDSNFPNRTNDQNSTINGPNPWMNRTNGLTNPPYPMMQPWRGSFPMYNSYLNNDSQYYNMFNPYSGCMGYDAYSNNINARNGVGSNDHTWVQNYHANLGIGHSNFNSMIPQLSGINSGWFQDNNNTNQGMNLSLSQNNSMELDDSLERESGLNSSLEQPGVESINVESLEGSAQCYGSQMSPAFFSGYNKNDTPNLDFGAANVPNADDQREENQPQIPNYISERLASFEGCFQRFDSQGTSSGAIAAEVMNNREMEMSKLRQELADFTRQYSEDTSPLSQIPQEDEIFDCMMSQDLQDTDESSSS